MRRFCIAMIALVMLLATHAVVADSVVVNPDGSGDYLSIQSALDWAPSGSYIQIAGGTYAESLEHLSDRRYTLMPQSSGDTVRLVGDGVSSSMITCSTTSTLLIYDLELDGSTNGVARGIMFNAGTLYVDGTTITGFSSVGIRMKDEAFMLYVSGCIFENNNQGIMAAGISVSSTLMVDDSEFNGNGAPGMTGSGIRAGSAIPMDLSMMVALCTFSGNTGASGSAISAWNIEESNISANTFIGNTCNSAVPGEHGGAIAILEHNSWDCNISICTFIGNNATGTSKGGAVAVLNEDPEGTTALNLTDSTFSGNTSGAGGGAIYVDVASKNTHQVFISSCDVIGNSTGGAGGGVLVMSEDTTWISDSYFCANLPDPIAGPYDDGGSNTVVDTCGTGACCIEGACGDLTEEACDSLRGFWLGTDVACGDVDCSEPITGACCLVHFCDVMSSGICNLYGGVFHIDTPCMDVICDPNIVLCPGDFNFDGTVDVLDLLAVIAAWGSCN